MFKKGDIVRLKDASNPRYAYGIITKIDISTKPMTADVRWGKDNIDAFSLYFGSSLYTETWVISALISVNDPDTLLKEIL